MRAVQISCDAEETNGSGERLPTDQSAFHAPLPPLPEVFRDIETTPRARGRVLLVEDDALIRENLCEILELEGYDVLAAIDGLHALELLQTEVTPDLVITDLQMPRANGWVLAMELRREPRLARLPLVVISGVHDSRSAGGFLGAAATFQKPFDVPDFLDTLERLLDQRRKDDQTDVGCP